MKGYKKLSSWKEQAIELFSELDKAIDGGQQIKLLAIKLQQTYEVGIGDGISMEQGMKEEGDH